MSLKAFHLVFIVASIALSLFLGRWCLDEYQMTDQFGYLLGTVGSVGAGALMLLYLLWFLKKTKKFSFLVLCLLLPQPANACAVCVGNPNSVLSRSANNGVGFLLAVIIGLLCCFAGVFIYWAVRARRLAS